MLTLSSFELLNYYCLAKQGIGFKLLPYCDANRSFRGVRVAIIIIPGCMLLVLGEKQIRRANRSAEKANNAH